MKSTIAKWMEKSTIVKVDCPGSYENSGKIALIQDGMAGIFLFGHCSCNGTWEDSEGSGKDYQQFQNEVDWVGTPDELVALAKERGDIAVKGRVLVEKDYDYKEWVKFYDLIVQWDSEGRAGKPLEYSF